MLYPLCGWIAEIYACKFKMIMYSYFICSFSSMCITIIGVMLINLQPCTADFIVYIPWTILTAVSSLLGLGMYEANAIQSGMDQMLEASSDQLSSFIHWYFWCSHIGSAIFFYGLIACESLVSNCYIVNSELPITINHLFGWGSLLVSIVQLLTFIVGICITAWMKKYLYTEMSRNSLHLIFNVLKYAFNHKSPERRSAFTYWENGIPSRIDLGKDKYGGPFTYEQIEDVKAFFRLLLLILSLFGFHLLGDGFSYSHRVMNTFGCPSIMPFLLIVANPKHVPTVVVLAGVPIIQCVRRCSSCIKFYFPSMLKRLWIGLFMHVFTYSNSACSVWFYAGSKKL